MTLLLPSVLSIPIQEANKKTLYLNHSPHTFNHSKLLIPSIKGGAPNAHYVQLPISHGKTDTQVEIRLLYRVLAHSNPQGRAFAA